MNMEKVPIFHTTSRTGSVLAKKSGLKIWSLKSEIFQTGIP